MVEDDLNDAREEIARLRALLKKAEFSTDSGIDQIPSCPWCGGLKSYFSKVKAHASDCPAFTPTGEVR